MLTYTITVPKSSAWDATRAYQFMEQILFSFQTLVFRVVVTHRAIRWQMVDLVGYEQAAIETAIHANYPDAHIQVEPFDPGRGTTTPVYRYVAKYGHFLPEWVAPMKYVSDLKDPDPLANITQAMSVLQPDEQIIYTLIVVGFAEGAYKEGEKLVTRNVYTAGLLGLLFPRKEPRYVPELQRVLEDKLQTRLNQCLLLVQVDTPIRERLDTLIVFDSQLVHFDRPQMNGIRWVEENRNQQTVYVTDDASDIQSSALGLYAQFASDKPLSQPLQKLRQSMRLILDGRELAALWHLPHVSFHAPTMVWTHGKTVPLPMPLVSQREGVCLGLGVHAVKQTPVFLKDQDRSTHISVVGKSGTGKSTFLHHLIHQDIAQGRGVAVIDPHGNLVRDILRHSIPGTRKADVVILDLANTDNPPPLNPFAVPTDLRQLPTAGQVVDILDKLYDLGQTPRLADTLTMALMTMWGEEKPTLLDVERLFDDPSYRHRLVQKSGNLAVRKFWEQFERQTHPQQEQLAYPVIYRMRSLYGNPALLPILCHPEPLDLGTLIAQKKIILVSLSVDPKLIPTREQELIGAMLVSAFQVSVPTTGSLATPFGLYIDEAQRLVTTSLPRLLEDARKRGLYLTLANQYFKQLAGETLDAVMGNMGALVAFQVGHEDAAVVARYMRPGFDADALLNMDMYQAAVWMREAGQMQPAFSLSTFEPLRSPDHQQSVQREVYLRHLSIQQYTPKTRADILKGIDERYAPKATPAEAADEAAVFDPLH